VGWGKPGAGVPFFYHMAARAPKRRLFGHRYCQDV